MATKRGGGGSASKKSATESYRSAKTGRYVSDKYGKSHPATTVKETNKKK